MPSDPIKKLQHAARAALQHVNPEARPKRVIVVDTDDERAIDVRVPSCCGHPGGSDEPDETPEPEPGWSFSDTGRPLYDGKPVLVARARWKLLRVLVEADEPIPTETLRSKAFDKETTLDNARYHLRLLKGELARAFPEFEGDVITGGSDGMKLVLR